MPSWEELVGKRRPELLELGRLTLTPSKVRRNWSNRCRPDFPRASPDSAGSGSIRGAVDRGWPRAKQKQRNLQKGIAILEFEMWYIRTPESVARKFPGAPFPNDSEC